MAKYFMILMLGIGLSCSFYSCAVLEVSDKIYLYDRDMQLNSMENEFYELSIQSYREGATESNGSKSGGGCGCY